MKDPSYLEDARRIRLDANWLGSREITEQVREVQKTPQAIIDRLRELLARG